MVVTIEPFLPTKFVKKESEGFVTALYSVSSVSYSVFLAEYSTLDENTIIDAIDLIKYSFGKLQGKYIAFEDDKDQLVKTFEIKETGEIVFL